MIASLLIIPFFLALSIALLKSFNSLASLLPKEESLPNWSSCLNPTPTPPPKAPPAKLGPTVTTAFPDASAYSINEAFAANATSHLPEAKSKFTSSWVL